MYILQQLYSTNSLSTACLGQVIIKIMQLKILLRVQWTRLVVRGLMELSGKIYVFRKRSVKFLHLEIELLINHTVRFLK